jgi:phosphopantothenoylcysteine synthetase/decarboxylase
LAEAGHEVELLSGYYSTCPPAAKAQGRQTFTTTEDLRRRLASLASPEVGAVFHAAAVSDFTFGKIWERLATGELRQVASGKIPTRVEGLLAELKPTGKIIAELRGWFPKARLTGWKYELEGDRIQAVARGGRQIEESGTDACVVNGLAYGKGFGLVTRDGVLKDLADREALHAALEGILRHGG